MALCVEIGNNTSALGLCCIAVGDGLEAIGAFQVKVSDSITLPENLNADQVKVLTEKLKKMISIYKAMEKQGHAPSDFGYLAEKALMTAIWAMEKKIDSEETK